MTPEECNNLRQRLEVYKRNRDHTEDQIASCGGNIGAPLALINQLRDANEQIDHLQLRLSSCVPVTALYANMWSYSQGNMHDPTHYQIDLEPYYESQKPDQSAWNDTILPLLRQFAVHCDNQSSPYIAGYVSVPQPAAIALGAQFLTPSRYTLWIKQTSKEKSEWWQNRVAPDNQNLPLVHTSEGAGEDAVVEVCVIPGQDTLPYVTTTIDRLNLSIGKRISIAFRDTADDVRNAAHAVAIAQQVRQQILIARRHGGGRCVHLFLATPVALTAFIGTQLNACGSIQCYEHRKEQDDYVPACLLRG